MILLPFSLDSIHEYHIMEMCEDNVFEKPFCVKEIEFLTIYVTKDFQASGRCLCQHGEDWKFLIMLILGIQVYD